MKSIYRGQQHLELPSGITWARFGQTTNPTVHVDQVLTNLVMGYRPNDRIWDKVAPVLPVAKQSDFYLVHDRGDMLRREDARRAPGVEASTITRKIGSGTYYALNYALKMGIVIEDEVNADPMYKSELFDMNALFLVDLLDLDIDARVGALVTTVANVGSGAGVASAWTTNNSNPIGNINTALDVVEDSTGKRPNVMTLGLKAWRNLRRHSDIRNIIFGTNNGGGYPSGKQVADLFELDEINIGGTYENQGNETQAESLTAVWGAHVVLHRRGNDGAGQRDISAFRAFRWSAPGLPNMQVERHPYDGKTKSSEIEVGYYQAEKVTAPSYAYVIRAVDSST